MNPETQSGVMNFGNAFNALMSGEKLTADFLPPNIYIELQKPDANSMNSEPYLKMVTLSTDGERRIEKCEPWEPGRRSLFSTGWKVFTQKNS